MTQSWLSEYLTLHACIKLARHEQGLTLAEAGAVAGICEQSYRDFEAGRGDLPAARVFRLADALGIRVHVQRSQHGADQSHPSR